MIGDFRLQVFLSVADNLSFTRAADILGITQPAITKHIGELERQIGAPLFARHGSSISLTDKGRAMIIYAQKVVQCYDQLNDALVVRSDSYEGQLRVGASTTISQYILPPLLAKFSRAFPRVELTVVSGNSEMIAQKITEGKIDFGLVEGDTTHRSLHYENFASDRIVLVTSADNREIPTRKIPLSRLTTIPLIIREKGSGTLSVILHTLQEAGINRSALNVVISLDSSESIVRYLLNSRTAAFISLAAVADYISSARLRVVDIESFDIKRSLRFVSLHGSQNPLAETFQQFILHN